MQRPWFGKLRSLIELALWATESTDGAVAIVGEHELTASVLRLRRDNGPRLRRERHRMLYAIFGPLPRQPPQPLRLVDFGPVHVAGLGTSAASQQQHAHEGAKHAFLSTGAPQCCDLGVIETSF